MSTWTRLVSGLSVMEARADYRPDSLQGVQRLHHLGDPALDLLPLVAKLLHFTGQGLRLARVGAGRAAVLLRGLQLLLELLQPWARLGHLVVQVLVLLLEALDQVHRLADLVLQKLEAVLHRYSPRISAPRAFRPFTTASSDPCTSSPVKVREGSW